MLADIILIIIYNACFTSEVLQNLIIKTIYEVAITIINIINIYHIANRQTWCYQAYSHHMVYKRQPI